MRIGWTESGRPLSAKEREAVKARARDLGSRYGGELAKVAVDVSRRSVGVRVCVRIRMRAGAVLECDATRPSATVAAAAVVTSAIAAVERYFGRRRELERAWPTLEELSGY